MFYNANYTNASQSHFSNVGRDQNNEYRVQSTVARDQYIVGRDQVTQTINVIIPDTASQETIQCVLGSICHVPPPSSSTFIITSHHNHSPYDVASNLVVEIKRLLVDLMKFSVDYLYLQDLLNRLHQTLFLTGLAIQAYEDSPLGPNLVVIVIPTVEQCHGILQHMLDSIEVYRRILYSTPIRDLWPLVLWSTSKVLELVWKLSARQMALGQVLVALNSQVFLPLYLPFTKITLVTGISSIYWEDLGNKLRAGRLSLQEFRTYSSQGPASASLRNIQITKILVLDHLGQYIPVPTMFCSTWEVRFFLASHGHVIYFSELGLQLHHSWLLQRSTRIPLCGAG
jgi:hypothetical protein